jgi:EAL domain-containing protein (putative c-di-GMP-specific phosphodiesterase class I)
MSIGAEAELSRLFRSVGVRACSLLPGNPKVFLNTHPAEFDSAGFLESFDELRRQAPDVDLVIEIHEVALTAPNTMARLREHLSALGIGLAYDDFGTGRARLLDVVEVPPDYLKFDISLIRGIDRLESKQRMLENLVGMAIDLGILPAAEGIETVEEADVCRQLGFRYGQGYLLGRPSRAEAIRAAVMG